MGNVAMAMVCGGAHCLEIYPLEMFYCLVHEILKLSQYQISLRDRGHMEQLTYPGANLLTRLRLTSCLQWIR